MATKASATRYFMAPIIGRSARPHARPMRPVTARRDAAPRRLRRRWSCCSPRCCVAGDAVARASGSCRRAAQKEALQAAIDAQQRAAAARPQAAAGDAARRRRGAAPRRSRCAAAGWPRTPSSSTTGRCDGRPGFYVRHAAALEGSGRRGAGAARLGAAQLHRPRRGCRRSTRRPAWSRCAGRIAPPPAQAVRVRRRRGDPARGSPSGKISTWPRFRARRPACRCGRPCRCCSRPAPRRRDGLLRDWPRAGARRREALRLRLPVVRAQRPRSQFSMSGSRFVRPRRRRAVAPPLTSRWA